MTERQADELPDPPASEVIEGWLAEFIDRREEGEELDAESFAAEHPEHADEILRALRSLEATEGQFPSSAMDLPARVGAYRVLGEIGRGGMGRVLRVEHEERPGEALAMKMLHVSLEQSPRALERFRREGEALQRLNNPFVVAISDTGMAGVSPYIVMELIEGVSLAELIRAARERVAGGEPPHTLSSVELTGKGTGFERKARIVARIARAVEAAHREGVLHRDIKPRNVLLRANGDPVLIDFGLMRSENTPTLTGSGDMIGTPQYMAPEQARGERVDQRTDVYALGSLLYELLTLTPPRTEEDTLAVLRAAGRVPVPRMRSEDRPMPKELVIIVQRATSFLPRWRYSSAAELATDLESYLEGTSIAARSPGPVERSYDFWLRHKRLVAASWVLLLLGLIGYFAWPREDPQWKIKLATEAMGKTVSAWLRGDLSEAREGALEYARVFPEDMAVEFLLALAEDRVLDEADHPAMKALISAEKNRRAGRPEAALRDFGVVYNLVPGSALPLVLNGLAALDAKDMKAAEWAFANAAHWLPMSLEVHCHLGDIYWELQQFEDSRLALETAVRLDSSDPLLWYKLARARYECGDATAAFSSVAEGLDLGGESLVQPLAEYATRLEDKGLTSQAAEIREELERRGLTPP